MDLDHSIRRFFLSLVVLLMVATLSADAEARSIHIEWGYTPPTEPGVTGFQLYQEGAAVCAFPGADITAGDCEVELAAQITNFTLTAMFDDGTESPHSAPFAFNSELHTGITITWNHWLWFGKPGHKHIRVGGTGVTGARLR